MEFFALSPNSVIEVRGGGGAKLVASNVLGWSATAMITTRAAITLPEAIETLVWIGEQSVSVQVRETRESSLFTVDSNGCILQSDEPWPAKKGKSVSSPNWELFGSPVSGATSNRGWPFPACPQHHLASACAAFHLLNIVSFCFGEVTSSGFWVNFYVCNMTR